MSDDLSQVFQPGEQFKVDTPGNRVALVFSNVADGVPMPVSMRCGGLDGILRFGGTTRVELQDQAALFDHVRAAFGGATLRKLALMSGGTRVLGDDDRAAMTILEIPWLIRRWHPECRTLGSAARTRETSSLVGARSTFIPSDQIDSDTIVHPGIDLFWFVQVTASQTTDDHGLDVPLYFDHMDDMREEGAATGLWIWGGGRVTTQEITLALKRGHPCAVVKGSGRIADALASWVKQSDAPLDPAYVGRIEQMLDEGADMSNLTVIHDPAGTQRWLRRTGLSEA